MNYKIQSLFIIMTAAALLITGCSEEQTIDKTPLMGLSWFAQMGQIKESLSSSELVEEREANGMKMLDYNGAKLFDTQVSVTLCFTDKGLVGINYHDIKRNQNYLKWLEQIEDRYGIPNENAIDCASWFEDPVGKNTSVYLFGFEDGVQISFYATDDTPDKSYQRKRSSGNPK